MALFIFYAGVFLRRYFEPISPRNVWILGIGLYWKNSRFRAQQSYFQGNVMEIPLLKEA